MHSQSASSCLISPHFAAGAVGVGRGAASFLATESTGTVLIPRLMTRIAGHAPGHPNQSLCPVCVGVQRREIHLFAGRAVKRERRKGSSRRQQPAHGAAVNEVARELLRSARLPKRENGGRRYIKHDGMIASRVGSCLCC